MSEQRSQKAVSSFIFKFVESIGMQGISFVVNVILARLLDTSDYGVLSMLTVFISLSQVFVISGLNSALIQKKEVDEKDISSVFWLSLGIACVLYAILFLCAPAIAAAYRAPELKDTLRVLALVLLPGALVSVQHAMVARQMAFRRQMYVGLGATVVSGAVGIGMAMGGFSYWALVGQQLTNQVVTAVLLLFLINWKPVFTFSWNRLRGLIGYGWKLLASSLLDTGYGNLNTAVIGLRFSQSTLGEFTRGKQFPELLMNAVNGSAQCRVEYDTDGREIARAYEDAQGSSMITRDGYHRIEFVYDDFERIIEEHCQDTDGAPIVNAMGYQMKRIAYDALDRITQETYFASDGTTKIDTTLGYADVSYGYDRYGNVNQIAYYGANGWGATDESGAARIERIYDENGELLSEKKYDLTRTLIP